MKINELKENTPVDSITVEVLFRPQTPKLAGIKALMNLKVKDETGECTLQLWEQQVTDFADAKYLRLTKGFCKVYKGVFQVSTGKYGKLEIVSGLQPENEEPKKNPVSSLKLPAKNPVQPSPSFTSLPEVKKHIEQCVNWGVDWVTAFPLDNAKRPSEYIEWARTSDGGSLQLDDGQLIVLYNLINERIKSKDIGEWVN